MGVRVCYVAEELLHDAPTVTSTETLLGFYQQNFH